MQYARYGALAVVMLFLMAAVAYLGGVLVQTSTDLDTKTTALAQEEAANAVLEQTNTVLLTDQARLEVYLEEATERFGVLSSENVSLRSDLVTAADRYALLEADLERLTLRHDELASAHDALKARYEALEGDYGDASAQNEALAQRFAALERLAERLPALQKRIAALEAQLAADGGG